MRAEAGAGPAAAAAAAEGRPSARAAVTLDGLTRSARTDAPVVALCALGMVGVAILGAGSLPTAAIAGWCVAVAAMLVLRHRAVGAVDAASATDGARRVRRAVEAARRRRPRAPRIRARRRPGYRPRWRQTP
jgi:uncharacterized membrane protein